MNSCLPKDGKQCFILQHTFTMYLLFHDCYNRLHLGYNKHVTVQKWTKITFPNTHRSQHKQTKGGLHKKGLRNVSHSLIVFPGRVGRGTWVNVAGYVPLASQSPYPIIVYFLATYRTHFSHFLENVIFTIPLLSHFLFMHLPYRCGFKRRNVMLSMQAYC